MIKKKNVVGELIFGVHPVVELLKAKRRKLITLYTCKPQPKGWASIEKLLPAYPVPIQYVTRDVMTRMVETPDHQGVVAWVHPFPFTKKMFDPAKHPFIVVLDGIQDPRNVGAILRSSYCTAVDGIVLVKKNAAPLTATAIKASAGLSEHMDIFIAPSIEDAMLQLQKVGYTTYLATFDGQNAATTTYTMPMALVIGSEGTGVSRTVLNQGIHVTLPQRAKDISYNASVATSLLTFLIAMQHNKI